MVHRGVSRARQVHLMTSWESAGNIELYFVSLKTFDANTNSTSWKCLCRVAEGRLRPTLAKPTLAILILAKPILAKKKI